MDDDAKSMALIELLRKEDEIETERRKREHDKANQDFVCRICLDGFNEENVFPLSTCEHIFHTECLQQYLNGEIDSGKYPFKVPC